MMNLSHLVARFWLLIAITGLIAGCTPSKVSQCNKLSSNVNKIRPIAEQFQTEGKAFETAAKAAITKNDLKAFKASAASSSEAFDKLINELNGLIKEIQQTNLKDETLVGLRDRYVQNATAINAAFQETSTALATISKVESNPQSLKALQQSITNLNQTATKMRTLVQEENQMVSEFNTYCGANK